ncbi:MAG: hypothetical protein LQ348_000958 [Seirophora lacunosa]|nr:MAG: hypothetical protein LQ348_000958 [Seirophora lacunosa]
MILEMIGDEIELGQSKDRDVPWEAFKRTKFFRENARRTAAMAISAIVTPANDPDPSCFCTVIRSENHCALYGDLPVAPIWVPFNEARKAGFSVPGKNHNSTWAKTETFALLGKPTTAAWLHAPIPPTTELRGDERAYRWWVKTMHRLLETTPTIAVDRRKDRAGEHLGYTWEDWYRAYVALKLARRQERSTAPDGKTGRKQNAACIMPDFISHEDRVNAGAAAREPSLLAAANVERDTRWDQLKAKADKPEVQNIREVKESIEADLDENLVLFFYLCTFYNPAVHSADQGFKKIH